MPISSTDIRNWTIYKITSPSGRVYIGKTSCLRRRTNTYRMWHKRGRNTQSALFNSFQKYGFSNHTIEPIDNFSSTNSYASGKEMFWIRSHMSNKYKYPEQNGLNLTDGGEGGIVYEESKRKMSESKRGMVSAFKGRKHTAESNLKNRNAHIGKPSKNKGESIWGEADRKRIGLSKVGNKNMLGKKMTTEYVTKMKEDRRLKQGKPVLMYDLNGVFLKEIPSIRAVKQETGMSLTSVKKILNGGRKNPIKFIFKFK